MDRIERDAIETAIHADMRARGSHTQRKREKRAASRPDVKTARADLAKRIAAVFGMR